MSRVFSCQSCPGSRCGEIASGWSWGTQGSSVALQSLTLWCSGVELPEAPDLRSEMQRWRHSGNASEGERGSAGIVLHVQEVALPWLLRRWAEHGAHRIPWDMCIRRRKG